MEQQHDDLAATAPPASLDSPAAAPPPPPPAVPLPPHLGLPAKLQHTDSASSVAAQPPTPVHPQTEPAPVENGSSASAPASFDAKTNGAPHALSHSHETYNEQAEEAVEHEHAHPGLGSIQHEWEHRFAASNGDGAGMETPPAGVDVLADVAMGEAVLGLAEFAAGAGSGDVKEGSPGVSVQAADDGPAIPVPPTQGGTLKRSSPDEAGDAAGSLGFAQGGEAAAGGDARDAKRVKVEPEPTPAAPAAPSPSPYPAPDVAPPPPATPSNLEPNASTPSFSAAAPDSSVPAPAASPAPIPVQGYDPSAFTSAPTLASSASPYPQTASSAPPMPVSAPTMSPSDLHTFAGGPAPGPSSASMPPLHSAASPAVSSPNPAMLAASPDAFQNPQQPVASTSAAPAPATDADASPAPPPPEPIAIMTKEQQKHAINMVRNLKRNKNAPPFLKPVDAVALHIPDYYKIILEPMDLGTVETRLQATSKAMQAANKAGRTYGLDYSEGRDPNARWEGQVPESEEPHTYRTVAEFKYDLDLVWNNCFRYNGPRDKNPVSAMAGNLMDAAEKAYRAMPFAPAVSPYPPKEPPKPVMPAYLPPPHPAENTRPKREIHAPAKDLPYLESAGVDITAGGIYNLSGIPGHAAPPKKAKSAQKIAQEQLRFCKEVIKELFKKTHESYAFPFYQPVDLNVYPQYTQYVQTPMDLSTIRGKLEHNQYPLPPYQAFEHDVRLVFANCYAFNPAGTAVNDWGHRLEAVFETKWAERPMAYEDDSEDEDESFSFMEQQLIVMQQNLELMRQNKKAQKEAKRLQHMQAQVRMPHVVAPLPPPPPKPKKPTQQQQMYSAYANSPYGAPQAVPRPKKPSGARTSSGGMGGMGGGGGQRKPKRPKHDDDSDDYYEDDGGAYYGGGGSSSSRRRSTHHAAHHAEPMMEEYVDFDMKRELAVKIVAFEGDQLEEAINIIRRGRPDLLGAANQEIELDIDQLDQATLLNLYRYVCPGSQPATRAIQAPQRAGSSKPVNKGSNRNARKNLDEDLESQRIEALEAQLRQFDQPADSSDAGAVPQEGSGGGAQGEGDQASSDSSDDDSDSDSDME
ncbi:bromodomain-containing factor 1 [Rhodotorula toruloides]|uniref:Bromodomain-containing factor 1 n=1 Tax=Rhodotorula toruloides TaxID=5286 RepID=A0A511KJN9_RHOTO|nr:bromodomain-containing factor 1 [Rhodotorula toruloides]